MMCTNPRLGHITVWAKNDYDAWKKANPGKDPVADPLADALWNLERAAHRVRLAKRKEGS